MTPIRVIYRREVEGWWAESPDVDGWTAAADTYEELRDLVENGVRFALETDDIVIEHYLPAAA